MAQLDAQNGSLDPLHAVVVTFELVIILAPLAPVAQHADGTSIVCIVRRYCATFSVGTQVLTGIKAKAAQITDATYAAAFISGAVGLRRVLDHDEAVVPGNLQDGIHIGWLTV